MKSINLPLTLGWITQRQDLLIEHTEKVLQDLSFQRSPDWAFLKTTSAFCLQFDLSFRRTLRYLRDSTTSTCCPWEEQGEILPSSFWNQQLIPSAWPPFCFRKSHQHHTSCQMIQFVFNKTRWLSWVSRPTRPTSSDDFWRVKVARLCVWSAV